LIDKDKIIKKFNVYSSTNLLLRLLFDIAMANIGMFMGSIITMMVWMYRWPMTPQTFFWDMFQQTWFANIPLLSLACLFGFTVCGLYGVSRKDDYKKIITIAGRSVLAAFFVHILLIYAADFNLSRTMFASGWFFIVLLIFISRLSRSFLFKTYRLLPLKAYNPSLERIVQDLTILTQQQGWVPPEGLPSKAAWPYFADDEVLSAAAVLRSGKINQWTGKEVEKFQEDFAAACGVKHAIALANGTVALELALRVYGIGPGDEVVATPRTFIASASCAVLQGATPIFADVDRDSQNITAETIRKVLSPRTKAIIAVHLAGWPCEMEAIMALAAKRNLIVIEDCAQAHGAKYKDRPVGSFGHVAAYSFCQDKIMTTGGEGGMLLTNDDKIWASAWAFKDHGKNYDSVYHKEHPPGFRWLHDSFGTNWRMTEMQAAIGRVQLRKLPDWVEKRRRNAAVLMERFAGLAALRVTSPSPEIYHSYYKYYVFVRPERLKPGWDPDRIMNEVVRRGIPCFTGSCSEIYMEKAFQQSGLQPAERLPVARELGETSLMFLVHPTLTEKDMEAVVAAVRKVMKEAVK
jgi:dTDP-4-amino-4,6-dideoxygalactose transaminase